MKPSLNLPLEQLLTSGGDSRLDVDPTTGRNRYGCTPRPSDVIPFGSCTSSSVSQRGLAAARAVQRTICGSPDSRAAAHQYSSEIRKRLGQLLTLSHDTEIALAPSGTDVEFLALALAAGNSDRPIVNIVVGPTEVGSGTPMAAACRHYDTIAPSGAKVNPGQPLSRALAERVSVRSVGLRTDRGDMLSESEIDQAVTDLVVEATRDDAVILLHVVAHSKTGVHAPSLACVQQLRRADPELVVVVDAAQGRVSRRGLRDALQNDYMVIFTGSKFYGGPPFSGALLVPPKFNPVRRGIDRLPKEFGDYFTAGEMPEPWSATRRALPGEPNYGTLLRWSAAIAEMDAYYKVPSESRLRILRYFESEVPRIFSQSRAIRLLECFPPLYDDQSERLLESKTTVYGFWVIPPGARQPLGQADLKEIHGQLVDSMPATTDRADAKIVVGRYHIGQPVHLGHAGYVLRIALGGELISRVDSDDQIGSTLESRIQWLGDQIAGMRRKVELLAQRKSPTTSVMPALAPTDAITPDMAESTDPFTAF